MPAWAAEAIEPNGIMDYIAKFNFKLGSDTPQLSRLKFGFLIKEIFGRFSKKINSTLRPNRSLWLYSAHDFTIANILNSFGLFEVFMNFLHEHFGTNDAIYHTFNFDSYIFLPLDPAYILNSTKQVKISIIFSFCIGKQWKTIHYH